MRGDTPERLRRWPAFVIVGGAAAAIAGIWLPPDSPIAMSQPTVTLIVVLVSAAFLLLWWVLLSRARWRSRLVTLVVLAALGGLARRFVELRGLSGDLVPRLAWRTESPLPAPPPPTPATPEPPATTPPSTVAPAVVPPAVPAPAPRDFPQFLGPTRDATLRGVHLASRWDDRAPVALWRQPIGRGWSGFAVADGLAVTLEQRDGREMVVAYDLESGRLRWSHRGGEGFESTMAGDGPRTTPAIHAGRVFTLGVQGVLRALELATGRLLFEKDVLAENGARRPPHGVSASPLVVDGLVVVLAGGPGGRSLVAYDAGTGERRWSGGDDPAAYSSPLVATLGGVRQIVVLNLRHLTGHDLRTGDVLWQDPSPDEGEKVSQPVILGDDRVFVSMAYGVGGRLVHVQRTGGSWRAGVLWHSPRLKAKFTQVVFHGGFLYGLDEGVLACLDPKDGGRRWKSGRYGHGQVLLVDELLLVQAEGGDVVLIEPNPGGLTELGRFPAVAGAAWATPALAGDLLLVRSDVEAACYRLPTVAGGQARSAFAGGR